MWGTSPSPPLSQLFSLSSHASLSSCQAAGFSPLQALGGSDDCRWCALQSRVTPWLVSVPHTCSLRLLPERRPLPMCPPPGNRTTESFHGHTETSWVSPALLPPNSWFFICQGSLSALGGGCPRSPLFWPLSIGLELELGSCRVGEQGGSHLPHQPSSSKPSLGSPGPSTFTSLCFLPNSALLRLPPAGQDRNCRASNILALASSGGCDG